MSGAADVCAAFGRSVRALRHRQGMSQEDLAARSGLDRSYVGGIERGERNVSLRNIKALADGLEVPLADLMRDVD